MFSLRAIIALQRRILPCLVAVQLLLLPSACVMAQKPNPVDAEARVKARQIWEKLLTKCGDSYYLHTGHEQFLGGVTVQYKEVVFQLKIKPISRADQLNGYEFNGTAYLYAALYRSLNERADHPATWGPWSDGSPKSAADYAAQSPGATLGRWYGDISSFVTVPFGKYSGQWRTYPADLDEIASRKLACSAIPGTAEYRPPSPVNESEESPAASGNSSSRRTEVEDEHVYDSSDANVVPPKPRLRFPHYSEEARKAGLEGTVRLSLLVDKRGSPSDIKVLSGLGMGLDEEAVNLVKSTMFFISSALKDWKPVNYRMNFDVKFVVKHPLEGPVFDGGKGAPGVDYIRYPMFCLQQLRVPTTEAALAAGKNQRIDLSFVVDTSGYIHDVTVVHGAGMGLDERAVKAVEDWQCEEPGQKGNALVNVRMQNPLYFWAKKCPAPPARSTGFCSQVQ